ncbi:MAG: hypothetical protein H8E41_07645 [Desulfobulbaceae bacterium]|uniref:GxxExxY protein n=1 Tax=Candidatus Desulfobia pelagia TaxID=2841692 RepID=A0A8J6TFR0_9BACT|nr:hypothetical protein [Candidatus Desulfobia pelagia]
MDLILDGKFGTLPIEVKFSTSTSIKQLHSLSNFMAQHNAPIGVVVNNSRKIRLLKDNIIQIPVSFI